MPVGAEGDQPGKGTQLDEAGENGQRDQQRGDAPHQRDCARSLDRVEDPEEEERDQEYRGCRSTICAGATSRDSTWRSDGLSAALTGHLLVQINVGLAVGRIEGQDRLNCLERGVSLACLEL